MNSIAAVMQTPYDAGPEAKTRRERRRGRRRSEILRATAVVIAEQGYRGASLDQIAVRLDLAKASLYHYFPSKDAVIEACLETTARYVTTRLRAVARRGGAARERLRQMIVEQLSITTREHPELSRLFLQQLDWPPALAEHVRQLQREHERIFRRVLDDGVRDFEIDPRFTRTGLVLMYSVLRDLPHWLTARERDVGLEEIANSLLRLFPAPVASKRRR